MDAHPAEGGRQWACSPGARHGPPPGLSAPAALTPTSSSHCRVGQPRDPGLRGASWGQGQMMGPQGAGSRPCSLKRRRRGRPAARKIVSSGCCDRGQGAARPGKAGARPPGPPDPTPPQAPDRTAPAASSVHAGPLETQGSAPAAISLQPTCSLRTDGRGCWGHRGTRRRTAQNTRLERRPAAESQAAPKSTRHPNFSPRRRSCANLDQAPLSPGESGTDAHPSRCLARLPPTGGRPPPCLAPTQDLPQTPLSHSSSPSNPRLQRPQFALRGT